MDVERKAAEEAPSDFEGDSGVSLSEDVQGVEAVSPPRPARQQKPKERKQIPKTKSQAGKRKASPVSGIEEASGAAAETDTEEDTQIVPAPSKATKKKVETADEEVLWVGKAISKEQAKRFWPHRYGSKEDLAKVNGEHLAIAHYEHASVDGTEVSLGDVVSVQGPDIDYIAIVYELFESTKREKIFHARWFWRVADTVLKSVGAVKGGRIHEKMVLLSDWSNNDENDNPLGCIKDKLKVVYISPVDVAAGVPIPECDYWYNSYWAQSYNSIQHTPGPIAGVNPLHPNTQIDPASMPSHKGHSPAAKIAGPVDTFVPPPPSDAKPIRAKKGKQAAWKGSAEAPVDAEAFNKAGPSAQAGPSDVPGPSSKVDPSTGPGPSVQATPSEDSSPSKVHVVGLEKRPLEPTPSKKTASLTELCGGTPPSDSKVKVGGAKERQPRKAKAEAPAVPATPSTGTAGGRSRRAASRLAFKPSPKKGEVGSAEKPVALDSDEEEEVDTSRKTAPAGKKAETAAKYTAVPPTKEAAPEASEKTSAVAAEIGVAVQAAIESASAAKDVVAASGTISVEVTATATVTATVAAPKADSAAPATASTVPEVEVKAESALPKAPPKAAKLSDFLDGHKYPEAREFLTVLDMYAGCGGMSTGLGHGLGKAGVNLHHKWAVDMMECACETYKLNHPETHVRNESAENFFMVCIEWLRLTKIHIDGETDYELPKELVEIIRSTYVPNYRLSADEAPIAELEDDAAFESVFVEEEVIDEELAEEETKKKRRAKKPAAAKAKDAVAAKPPAKKSKSTKADPMTGRGGEPPKTEALQMFTPVLPPETKSEEKEHEASAPAAAGSPAKPIEVPDEIESAPGTKRKRQEKAATAGERRSVREKKDVDYAKEIPIEVEDDRPRSKKAKAPAKVAGKGKKKLNEEDEEMVDEDVYEVEYVYGIRWHRDREANFRGLQYRIRWKNYTAEWDTWEPEELTDGCPELLKEFIQRGVEQQILPLPGSVGLICGGPPCQGASGFNRFRNKDEPLMDPRNKQVIVFMDIARLLMPRYVLMENVVDILKFGDGILGRYAIRRLVNMGYQSRVGLLVAGSFGVPQFRMRTFVWGAAPGEVLPPYPLPTHMVEKVRNHVPMDWTHSMVAYDEDTHEGANLAPALVLGDALRDLPPIVNNERRDVVPYTGTPDCEFQLQVRRPPPGVKMGQAFMVVNDHHSLIMNEDDLGRSAMIPKKKGANFRDLPGVETSDDKTVIRTARPLLPSGKPIVPDYAISFIKGKSFKPFGRLWWDETVATVVTRAEPHNQRVLHPDQDRVLSIRENARLQGFPDYYKLQGVHPKNKYTLVGNAVAMPVAEALGKAMALAIFKDWDGSQPLCRVTPWTY